MYKRNVKVEVVRSSSSSEILSSSEMYIVVCINVITNKLKLTCDQHVHVLNYM